MAFFLRELGFGALLLSLLAALPAAVSAGAPGNWVVYYGDAIPSEEFLPYDVVLFDSEKHPPLRPLRNREKILLGYISAGEAEEYRKDFPLLQQKGVLLKENKHWPGHYIVDIRDPRWAKYLIEEKIPDVLHKRFNGVMLDTLDSPIYLEEKYPEKYPGMKRAAIELIKTIRQHYPEMHIMLNRAFPVLQEVAPVIDALLAESILVKHEPGKKEATFFPAHIYEEFIGLISAARENAPELKVYSLDYVHNEDMNKVKEIYQMHRKHGLVPYVSTLDLQTLYPEPTH